MNDATRLQLSKFIPKHRTETEWHRLLACGHQFTGWKPMPQGFLKRIMLLLMVFATTFTTAIAQDTKQGLARPEWQLRADLEFRLACQSSLQKLCLEVLQTHQKDPSDPANSKLLLVAGELLETTDGKLPTALPEHPASIAYVKARKAAVIEWNKAYKAKGRDLPAVALDSERKFQEGHRELLVPSPTSTPSNAKVNSKINAPPQMNTDSASHPTEQFTEDESTGGDRKSEKKLSDLTVKNAVILFKETEKYLKFKPGGETTVERQAASMAAKKVAFNFAEKQPDFLFTFPILDVLGSEKALTFQVDEPLEFEQLRFELGSDTRVHSQSKEFEVTSPAILKRWKSIKPGDLLRVRFKIGVVMLNLENPTLISRARVRFSIVNQINAQFVEKSIVDFQIIKRLPNDN